MPELPEVETIARGLAAALSGAVIRDVPHTRADYVSADPPGMHRRLGGRAVTGVSRHGKRLTLHLDGARVLIHLGMSGRLQLAHASTKRPPHTHLVIRLRDRDEELRLCDPRRFGGVWISAGDGMTEATGTAAPLRPTGARNGAHPGPLGPDALSLRWPAFRQLLLRHRQIKALLLDQRTIAGLGNIYVDEGLWAAGVHPLTPADAIPEDRARRLHRSLRRILKNAIAQGGSTLRDYRDATGSKGGYQRRHRVYGREGEPCRRCRTPIRRRVLAGRSSHFCPACQRHRR